MEYDVQLNEQEMLDKVKIILNKLDENKKLQDLAIDNGLDVKNKLELTETAKENIAVSIISLLIAKELQDPDYPLLIRDGLEKRKRKTNMINRYKNQSIQLITRYRKENQK